MKKIKEMPYDERPYERCNRCGPQALTDAELIAIMLRSGTDKHSVLDIAYSVLGMNGNNGISNLLYYTLDEYMSNSGIGKIKATQLVCMAEISKRIWRDEIRKKQVSFHKSSCCAAYYMQELRFLGQEELRAVFLDTRHRMIRDAIISRGTVDSSLVSIRDILIASLKASAVSIILIHNHPSGDPTPSSQDIKVTEAVSEGCRRIGIKLLDHIIIGDNSYYSFKEWDKI